jgi:hypothetical protein
VEKLIHGSELLMVPPPEKFCMSYFRAGSCPSLVSNPLAAGLLRNVVIAASMLDFLLETVAP